MLVGYERAHLVHCHECGMVFAARIPADAELADYYGEYGHAWHDSPITRKRYAAVLDSLEPYRHRNRLLDVGCGAGYFLEEARTRGWEVHGTEYSRFALDLAQDKGLNVVQAPLGLGSYDPDFFDVVTAFEVFEHVSDPMAEAEVVAHVLRDGGALYLTVPNFDALSRRLLGPRWSVIDYPEHLCYFTSKTIRSWLRRVGFVAESVASTGISLSRRHDVGASSPTGSAPCGEEQLRETIERSQLLTAAKAVVNAGLSGVSAGDTIKARFQLRKVRDQGARR